MVELLKINDLTSNSIILLALRILPIIFMILTLFIPILTIDYSGNGINAVNTIFSFRDVLNIKQGTSSSIPIPFNTVYMDIFFILVFLALIVTILLLLMVRPRYAEVTQAFTLIFLSYLFVSYYLIYMLDGNMISEITLHVTIGNSFYLIVLSVIFLFISFFMKFDLSSTPHEQ